MLERAARGGESTRRDDIPEFVARAGERCINQSKRREARAHAARPLEADSKLCGSDSNAGGKWRS